MTIQECRESRFIAYQLCFVTMIIGYLALVIPGLIVHFCFLPKYKTAQNDRSSHLVLATLSIIFGGPLLIVAGILLIISATPPPPAPNEEITSG